MTTSKQEFAAQSTIPGPASSRQEVRCAVRFPIALPVVLSTSKGDVPARSRNISANGALFELDEYIAPGVGIHFSLRMPGSVLGTPHDVLVQCAGRVVRCSLSQHLYIAAATIDEYEFAEQ
ncbi:MAG: PilZ domain-containing protein [Terracidiphilus sp.]